ncbi:hypothetical protein AB0J42_26785 [Nonomuraea sp. NPDC049649]
MGGKHAGEPRKYEPLKKTDQPSRSTDDTWPGGKGKHAKDDKQDGQKK